MRLNRDIRRPKISYLFCECSGWNTIRGPTFFPLGENKWQAPRNDEHRAVCSSRKHSGSAALGRVWQKILRTHFARKNRIRTFSHRSRMGAEEIGSKIRDGNMARGGAKIRWHDGLVAGDAAPRCSEEDRRPVATDPRSATRASQLQADINGPSILQFVEVISPSAAVAPIISDAGRLPRVARLVQRQLDEVRNANHAAGDG